MSDHCWNGEGLGFTMGAIRLRRVSNSEGLGLGLLFAPAGEIRRSVESRRASNCFSGEGIQSRARSRLVDRCEDEPVHEVGASHPLTWEVTSGSWSKSAWCRPPTKRTFDAAT